MNIQQLSPAMKVTQVKTTQAAGTTNIQSDAVDMSGFEGVVFVVSMGAITSGAATSANLQQSSTAALGATEADLEGSAITIADDDDNQCLVLDVYRPTKRYVNAIVLRATQNSVINSIVAFQYGAELTPTTNDASTVIGRLTLISPDEGTA